MPTHSIEGVGEGSRAGKGVKAPFISTLASNYRAKWKLNRKKNLHAEELLISPFLVLQLLTVVSHWLCNVCSLLCFYLHEKIGFTRFIYVSQGASKVQEQTQIKNKNRQWLETCSKHKSLVTPRSLFPRIPELSSSPLATTLWRIRSRIQTLLSTHDTYRCTIGCLTSYTHAQIKCFCMIYNPRKPRD